MIDWRIHNADVTESTNIDARKGLHGDVFTAKMQTRGKGRLDHKWLSPPNENLLVSIVLDVNGIDVAEVATLPLVAGLSVAEALSGFIQDVRIKWPNDVWVKGKKICGILCERNHDNVIVGIGVNVKQREFPPPIGKTATSLFLENAPEEFLEPQGVLRELLKKIEANYSQWKASSFKELHKRITSFDLLKGRDISVRQTDDDNDIVSGRCEGISEDGSLIVGSTKIYAGEAHVIQ